MTWSRILFSKLLKTKIKYFLNRNLTNSIEKPPWKVLFFGADSFSIFSLEALTNEYRKGNLISKLEVATTIKGNPNVVKLFSEKENLCVHKWPPNISYGQFDVGLVVSFGHLIPKNIIEKFKFGILNVHASLLPRWRGAAPIIYAIANGDTETGITIMKIDPFKFDVGEIVRQESVQIDPQMKMCELHSILGKLGAKNLIKTLESLPVSLNEAKPQPSKGVTYAPKVNQSMSLIKWDKMTSREIFNLARALDGIFSLQTSWKGTVVKLYNVKLENTLSDCDTYNPGYVTYDRDKNVLRILCSDRKFIVVEKIGIVGRKMMNSRDFNNGFIRKETNECRYFE